MQHTTRRSFIQQSSLAAAAFMINPSEVFKKNHPIGVQLYTLRNLIFKDPKGTLAQVAALGYNEVESFGYNAGKFFGMTATEIAETLKQNNLGHPSGHYGLNNVPAWDQAIEDAVKAGQKFMVIAYLVDAERKSIDDYKRHAATFNTLGEKCKKAGLQFAYHNHDFEFIDFNGQNGMDVLLNETDKKLVKFEMDIYWVAKANRDPVQLFNAHPKRFCLWHVKDMDKTEKKSFTEVGNGVIDFKKIFASAKKSGMVNFFVEQDISTDPMASIKKSYDYIKANLA